MMMGLILSLAPLFTMAAPEAGVTLFEKYPGYEGAEYPTGYVYITTKTETVMDFEFDLGNLEADKNFSIHIHSGLSCETHAQVGGHFWTPFDGVDPWNARVFLANESGFAATTWEIDYGYSVEHTIGHAVVIHNSAGVRAACGIITSSAGLAPDYKTAQMSRYPGYAGTLNVSGVVEVWDTVSPGALIVNFRLSGLNASTSGGVHIHVGKTCATSGPHYYASEPDPWTTTYTANANGVAEGLFEIDSGFILDENIAHAVVIHDAANTRIACGTLGGKLVGSVRNVVRYPGYSGSLDVNASVDIVFLDGSAPGNYHFAVNIENGERDTNMKFHIHAGLSCESAATIGGHFWAPFTNYDVWLDPVVAVDGNGVAQSKFNLSFGYSAEHFVGHAVVIHQQSGTPVACGIIKKDTAAGGIVYEEAVMAKYPLYNDSYVVTGDVQVWDLDATRQVVNYRLRGLPANVTGGGLHIHAGVSCSEDGGHFWRPMTNADPWLATNYISNHAGAADGSFIVASGYLLSDNKHHAVVVHDGANVKLACGLLGGSASPTPGIPPTPGSASPTPGGSASPTPGTNGLCPSEAIQGAFAACKVYDFTGPTCSAACAASLRGLVEVFEVRNATIPEVLDCLDTATPTWVNGNLAALKARIHPAGSGDDHVISTNLCNVTETFINGAAALSGLVAIATPLFLV